MGWNSHGTPGLRFSLRPRNLRRYDFHPEAALDLLQIWDFIAEDNPEAADKKPSWVIAVMHGRRSPRVMAAILRDRE
jgi:hypothetical protein